MFCREQEHKQKAQSASVGESAGDLVSYVEFQRNYRCGWGWGGLWWGEQEARVGEGLR